MKNIITIQSRRDNNKVRYGVCGAEERPSKLPRFLHGYKKARWKAGMMQKRAGKLLFVVVMRTALQNFNPMLPDTVNQAVGIINTTAPVTLQVAFQRFGFSDTGISVPVNIL